MRASLLGKNEERRSSTFQNVSRGPRALPASVWLRPAGVARVFPRGTAFGTPRGNKKNVDPRHSRLLPRDNSYFIICVPWLRAAVSAAMTAKFFLSQERVAKQQYQRVGRVTKQHFWRKTPTTSSANSASTSTSTRQRTRQSNVTASAQYPQPALRRLVAISKLSWSCILETVSHTFPMTGRFKVLINSSPLAGPFRNENQA